MNDIHYYEVNLLWDSKTRGTLNSPVFPGKIEVATPTEFSKVTKEKWTPEHLFVAAINSCLMSTFLLAAESSKIKFIRFESNAIGTIKKVDGKFALTEITIKPNLVIQSTQNESKARRVLAMSEKACAIANSIKTKIILEPIVTVQ
jgi:organic hydroperoxide reductase OsmC/OhrA